MIVYRDVDEVPYRKDSYLTIGTFDGIHLGHKKIIQTLVWNAQQKRCRSVVVTFYPHPQTVVRTKEVPIALLTPVDEKIVLLESLGPDVVLILPFSQELARLKPEIFVSEILVSKIGVQKFIIGYNHAFGQGRKGSEKLLRELGSQFDFSVDVVSPVKVGNEPVSSTRIRHYLLDGNVHRANLLLGRNYTVEGIVKKGKNIGEKFGFPTANIDVIGENKLVPKDGVYAVIVYIKGKMFQGMANIGYKPTVDGSSWNVEIHIHNFSDDLYNEKLRVEFIDRIRDEKRFDSIDALISQIKKDREKSIELLSKNL